MVLLRHLLGDVLRRLRLRQGRTLREVSAAARVSLGYLSEVERGQKEASSELLAAICTALNTPLSHVLGEVSDSFALAELQNDSVLTPASGPSEDGRVPVGSRRSTGPGASWSCPWPVRSPPSCGPRSSGFLPVTPGGWTPSRSLGPVGVNENHPAFDEVTRRVRDDFNDMVPV